MAAQTRAQRDCEMTAPSSLRSRASADANAELLAVSAIALATAVGTPALQGEPCNPRVAYNAMILMLFGATLRAFYMGQSLQPTHKASADENAVVRLFPGAIARRATAAIPRLCWSELDQQSAQKQPTARS